MTPPDDSNQGDVAPDRNPDLDRDKVQTFIRWTIGTGVVLMLGGFILIPLLPDAPVAVQWSAVIIGMLIFSVGMRTLWWGLETHRGSPSDPFDTRKTRPRQRPSEDDHPG